MSDGGRCSTALATPGLLNIYLARGIASHVLRNLQSNIMILYQTDLRGNTTNKNVTRKLVGFSSSDECDELYESIKWIKHKYFIVYIIDD